MRFSNKIISENSSFDQILKGFTYFQLHKLAESCGFIKRKRKFRAVDLVRICVFWPGKTSFPSLGEMLDGMKSRTPISKQCLDRRFNKFSVRFLRKLAGELLSKRLCGQAGLEMGWAGEFNRVLVWDSTVGKLMDKCRKRFKGFGGGASDAAFKVQYCFDLLSGNIATLLLQPARRSDSGYRVRGLRKNDLCLFDLGYFNFENLRRVVGAKAFYLCRFKFGTTVYVREKGEYRRICLLGIIRKMPVGQHRSMDVFLGRDHKLPTRLVLHKLPPEVGERIAHKLKSDKHNKRKGISKERLAFCHVNAYVTNICEEKLPAESARKVYSLRWQVEIIFKCWKSGFDLKNVPDIKVERFECFCYGCLIRIILATKFFWLIKTRAWNIYHVEISELTSFRILRNHIDKLSDVLLDRKIKLEQYVKDLWHSLTKNAPKSRKKGYSRPSEILEFGG